MSKTDSGLNYADDGEVSYIWYHPVADELFELPMKPDFEAPEYDIEIGGQIVLMGVVYVGEL